MNTIFLAQRLANHLEVNDPSDIDARTSLDVVDAINAGFQRLYRLLPGIYKQTTLSHTCFASASASVTFAATPGRTVTGTPFANRNGCSVDIAGRLNQIIDDSNVLDLYTGANTTTQATIYHDIIEIQDVIQRITGAVRLYDEQGHRSELAEDNGMRQSFESPNQVGQPERFSLVPVGVAQGALPSFYLKLWPLPDQTYTIRMEAELSTARVRFIDLTVARTLPLSDDLLEDCLIPLCLASLTKSPRWADRNNISRIMADAEMVTNDRIRRVPSEIGSPVRTISTPRGF